MHIAPYDNHNQPIIGADHPLVPLCYFNILHLKRGQSVTSHVPGYETCLVPATGTVDVTVCPFAGRLAPGASQPCPTALAVSDDVTTMATVGIFLSTKIISKNTCH